MGHSTGISDSYYRATESQLLKDYLIAVDSLSINEGNQEKTAGAIPTTGGTIPPVTKMPPIENTENHAQKPETGGTGETGGILDISSEEGLHQLTRPIEQIIQVMPSPSCSPSQYNHTDKIAIYRLGHTDLFACDSYSHAKARVS